MEIYTMTRPSMPPTAACAPSVLLPAAAAPVAWLAVERAPISPMHALLSGAHHVPVQAELAQGSGRISGINGTTGFQGLGVSVDSKGYVDERGVPPRGRPV